MMQVQRTPHRKDEMLTRPVLECADSVQSNTKRFEFSFARMGTIQNRKQHQFLLVLLGAWICITYTIIHGHIAVVRVLFVEKPDESTIVLGLVLPDNPKSIMANSRTPPLPDSLKENRKKKGWIEDVREATLVAGLETQAEGENSDRKTTKNAHSLENSHSLTSKNIQNFIRQNEKQAMAKNAALELIEPTNGCGNSQRWLNATRFGNIHDDPFLTDELVQRMILNLENVLLPDSTMSNVLEQTICHENSRFRNVTASSADDKNLRVWAVKLIYLALHYHQHRLAVPEAVLRYGNNNNKKCPTSKDLQKKHGVGVFDFECPDAKYLIMPLAGNGLGANVRGGTVGAFLLGLLSDRVVLFVNNAEQGGKFLQSPWLLASCPRKDYQCFFWPTSPCTLTQDEIGKAHFLTPGEYRKVMRGDISEDLQHHKVWTFNSKFIPGSSIPKKSSGKLYEYATKLISAVPRKQYPDYVTMLTKAAETILDVDEPPNQDVYNYAARYFKAHHALVFYSVRPKPSNAHQLERIMSDIVPEDFHPDTSVGLPIRGSDKCIGESECISFDQHMQVIANEWKKHQIRMGFTNPNPTVVFTTESKNVVAEQQTFVAEKREESHPFRFDFVMNTQDVHPDSGFAKDILREEESYDLEAAMLSSISSLKLQLLPSLSIGNCCSNFHALLNDFLYEGCGAASENHFHCLQENKMADDPRLVVCCGWHGDCKKQKQAAISSMST